MPAQHRGNCLSQPLDGLADQQLFDQGLVDSRAVSSAVSNPLRSGVSSREMHPMRITRPQVLARLPVFVKVGQDTRDLSSAVVGGGGT